MCFESCISGNECCKISDEVDLNCRRAVKGCHVVVIIYMRVEGPGYAYITLLSISQERQSCQPYLSIEMAASDTTIIAISGSKMLATRVSKEFH